MLHVHVFLVTPLGAGDVPQPGANQHECRVPVREAAYNPGPAPDFPIQSFNHVVRSDLRPMLRWKVAIGQRFFYAILYLLRCFLASLP